MRLFAEAEKKAAKRRVRLKRLLPSSYESIYLRLGKLKTRGNCIQRKRLFAAELIKVEAADKNF